MRLTNNMRNGNFIINADMYGASSLEEIVKMEGAFVTESLTEPYRISKSVVKSIDVEYVEFYDIYVNYVTTIYGKRIYVII